MSRHQPPPAGDAPDRPHRRRPRLRPAFALAPAALALLTALVFAPASLGSLTPLHGSAPGPSAGNEPLVAVPEPSARALPSPPGDWVEQPVDCAAPAQPQPDIADGCPAPGATDDHAEPLDLPAWQDPAVPDATPAPAPSAEASTLS